jgi:hypothetical protein
MKPTQKRFVCFGPGFAANRGQTARGTVSVSDDRHLIPRLKKAKAAAFVPPPGFVCGPLLDPCNNGVVRSSRPASAAAPRPARCRLVRAHGHLPG